MLEITIPATEMFDESKQEFVNYKEQTIQLEHSLVSLSKWESKWHKAFLSKKEMTTEETIDYVRCMTITKNVDPSIYSRLTSENVKQINDYIADPMTAVYFPEDKSVGGSGDTITSELIYYWMITLNIPQEYQKWHLNRLISLIKVCNIKNSPGKKMNKSEIMRRNASLNATRKAKMHTSG